MDVIRWRSAFSGGVERSRGVVLNQSEAAAVRRGWKSWSGVEWSECVVGAFVRSFVRSFGRSLSAFVVGGQREGAPTDGLTEVRWNISIAHTYTHTGRERAACRLRSFEVLSKRPRVLIDVSRGQIATRGRDQQLTSNKVFTHA